MAKYTLWPGNALERLVDDFLKRKGIDHRDVRSYRLDRTAGGLPIITLEMIYDEGPTPVAEHPMADVSDVTEGPGKQFAHTTPEGSADESCKVYGCITHNPRDARVSRDNPNIIDKKDR